MKWKSSVMPINFSLLYLVSLMAPKTRPRKRLRMPQPKVTPTLQQITAESPSWGITNTQMNVLLAPSYQRFKADDERKPLLLLYCTVVSYCCCTSTCRVILANEQKIKKRRRAVDQKFRKHDRSCCFHPRKQHVKGGGRRLHQDKAPALYLGM